jgi:hypothetical protein
MIASFSHGLRVITMDDTRVEVAMTAQDVDATELFFLYGDIYVREGAQDS